ncbi:MAG: hypothetical protein L0G25_00465 [Psychrobacter sp.]|nr:hypothetical protein [Psychrobacter sp.]
MPSVSEVQLNFATQKLVLTLTPDKNTKVKDIEKTIKRLGLGVSALIDHQHDTGIDERQLLATALLFLIIARCQILNATKLFYQNFVETVREQRRHQSRF